MSEVNPNVPASAPGPAPPAPAGRRRRFWVPLLAILLALLAISYGAVVLINRVFLTGWVARALPEGVLVRRVALRWPATVVVSHARWAPAHKPEEPWLQVPQATLDLDVSSLLLRRVIVRRVVLDHPRIMLVRDAEGGWNLPRKSAPSAPADGAPARWGVSVLAVEMRQGAVVFDDRRVPEGFHGELQACDLQVRHPFLPLQGWRAQVELDALAALRSDRPKAPVQLRGWVDIRNRDLEGVLTVKDFDIGAIEPYLNRGRVTVRLYQAQMSMQADLRAQRNEFNADCQLDLTHLAEGDISILGVNVLDIKDASGGPGRSLQLRLQVHGPLDRPRAWRPRIAPTGEQTIKLLRPLFEGRKETIILKVIPQVTGEKAVAGVEETVRSVQRGVKEQLKKFLEPSAPPDASTPLPVAPTPPPAVPADTTAPPATAADAAAPATEEPPPPPTPQ